MKQHFRVALAGNPNCGKTCIFNALTGARQHVGNYPGVTVESKTGKFTLNGMEIELIDLPGVYSLSSSSPEEDVVFQELTKPGIDLIIDVVDSSIPRRSLYLTTQLAELHIPMILAFNMSDDARRKGFKFDIPKLEKYFGSPIAQTVGSRIGGVKPLLDRLAKTLTELEDHGVPMLTYGEDIDDAIRAVADRIDSLKVERYAHIPARFFAIKLLEHDTAAMRIEEFKPAMDEVEKQIAHLWEKHAVAADTFMADRRYAMLAGACRDAISMTQERRREISDRIDAVMTNKYLGLPLFFIIIYLTFWFTFTLADPLMGIIEDDIFGSLNEAVKNAWNPETLPFLRSLLTDGVISGVGGVLVFLPNILFLFFAIAILEDSGYMARAAFVMDGIMRKFGLQGRSFVPLVLGFGCSVPAIMATRTIESERDRKTTIMVLPLMSCGARLPIYALIIPAFFVPKYQAFVMWLMYFIGVVIALVAARIMKSTLFKGDGEVYLMELPPYRVPTLRSLLLHMWDRGRMYLQKAGTIILATSVILFICNTYPEKEEFSKDYEAEIARIEESQVLTDAQIAVLETAVQTDALAEIFGEDVMKEVRENKVIPDEALEALGEEEDLELAEDVQGVIDAAQERADAIAALENEQMAEAMEYTISGRVGHALEPIFRPIGFDWKLTTASIGALAAKEVFVAQLGILYSEGEADEESVPLREQLRANYTPLQGFCIMLFCLLSIPCLATLAIIRRELNSWSMPFVEAGGLLALAYILTMIVYQVGSALHIGTAML
ncbi:MAG: ferrous iron transport protein B [Lentisphaeria bacterium]|nr:ferrous iron transport protein B [Lentisphaeria bacterium]